MNCYRPGLWLCAALAASLPRTLEANDSSAQIGAGGLAFTKTADIEMTSEELFVSAGEILVEYKFQNRSNRDVTLLVAFPLPDLAYQPDVDVGISAPNSENFVDFVTFVDGQRVEADVELRAIIGHADITERLREIGIPLNPYEATEVIRIAREGILAQLRQAQLLNEDDQPLWSLKTKYYWQQTFPRGRTTGIRHRYRPIAGGAVVTGVHQLQTNSHSTDFYRKFCVEPSFVDTVKRSMKPGADYPPFGETNVEYILTTGANWAAPIRRFRLVVDKGAPENLVSFCGDNVKRIGPTKFEMVATDYVPKQDLNVLILSPREKVVDDEVTTQERDFGSATCDELWTARNTIFKAAGYCFKTTRAISVFGNAGCKYDDVDQVPLSEVDRGTVNRIMEAERAKRCSR